jgi:hypothetical protein
MTGDEHSSKSRPAAFEAAYWPLPYDDDAIDKLYALIVGWNRDARNGMPTDDPNASAMFTKIEADTAQAMEALLAGDV